MAYATEAELTAYPVTVPTGASAALLLTRASRDVDRALLCAVYDATDAEVIAALRDATCEQVAGMIAAGDLTGTGATPPTATFNIGKIGVVRGGQGAGGSSQQASKVNGLWPQAWQALRDPRLAGKLTFRGPQTLGGVTVDWAEFVAVHVPIPATVRVQAYEGSGAYGDVFADPADVTPCVVEQSRRLVRVQTQDAAGTEQVSSTTVYCPPDTLCPPGSRVTWAGRTSRVLARSDISAHGLPLPEHVELNLE